VFHFPYVGACFGLVTHSLVRHFLVVGLLVS